MTEKMYYNDGYVSEFEATVSSVNGDFVTLDATAFFPGGGGQASDTGSIGGMKVTEVKEEKNEVLHKVPGHSFKVGDKLWCSVDWDRRYDLMKGHTAEHLLFSSLKREIPELEIVKIFITPESKFTVVDRDIPWETVSKAVCFANDVIEKNVRVRRTLVDAKDCGDVRGDIEAIGGDVISVVEIENVDASACCGVHIMETSEIGAIAVTKKVSGGKDGHELHFKIGQEAIQHLTKLACSYMTVTEILGCKVTDADKTAQNIKNELEITKKQLKTTLQSQLKSLKPARIGGVNFYSGIFNTSDVKLLAPYTEEVKANGGVALFVCIGKLLSIVISSGTAAVNCEEIFNETLPLLGGRGGGKPDFAQAGIPDPTLSVKAFKTIKTAIEKKLA